MVSSRTYRNLTPDTYAVAERFNVLLEATPCPHARGSRVWCAPQWDARLKLEENLSKVIPYFAASLPSTLLLVPPECHRRCHSPF